MYHPSCGVRKCKQIDTNVFVCNNCLKMDNIARDINQEEINTKTTINLLTKLLVTQEELLKSKDEEIQRLKDENLKIIEKCEDLERNYQKSVNIKKPYNQVLIQKEKVSMNNKIHTEVQRATENQNKTPNIMVENIHLTKTDKNAPKLTGDKDKLPTNITHKVPTVTMAPKFENSKLENVKGILSLEEQQDKLMQNIIHLSSHSESNQGWQVQKRKTKTNRISTGAKFDASAYKNLKAMERISWIFLANLEETVSEAHILEYLNNFKEDNYRVEKLSLKRDGSAFKIGVPSNMEKTLRSLEFWPKGTLVDRFYFPKKVIENPKANFLGNSQNMYQIK